MRSRSVLVAGLLAGCGNPAPATATPEVAGPDTTTFRFSLDASVPAGSEAYLCFAVDAPSWAGEALSAIAWEVPDGPVALHHATLMATPSTVTAGSLPCDAMPDVFSVLALRAPGMTAFVLPPGVAMSVPDGTRRFVVEAHVLRVAEGAPSALAVTLSRPAAAPAHVASWVAVPAPIPVIRPHDTASSRASCRFGGETHVAFDWPHMHRLGKTFHGRIVRADGTVEPLVDVNQWRFDEQPFHAVDATLAAGDSVETECTWENPTSDFVFAGRLSSDEMCNQGLIVWPATSVVCEP